jgi:hypothetical protein
MSVELVALVGRLTALLDHETADLRAMRLDALAPRLVAKEALVTELEQRLGERPPLTPSVGAAVARLDRAARANGAALGAARAVSERLVRYIAATVCREPAALIEREGGRPAPRPIALDTSW